MKHKTQKDYLPSWMNFGQLNLLIFFCHEIKCHWVTPYTEVCVSVLLTVFHWLSAILVRFNSLTASKRLLASVRIVVSYFKVLNGVEIEHSVQTQTKLPPFSLMHDVEKQNTHGNVSKISVNLTCHRHVWSRSTNHSPLAWRWES